MRLWLVRLEEPLKALQTNARWDSRFAFSVAELMRVWSLRMPLGAVKHHVGSSSSVALGTYITKISLVAGSPPSCSVVSSRARDTSEGNSPSMVRKSLLAEPSLSAADNAAQALQ